MTKDEDMEDLTEIQSLTGYSFRRTELLKTALTHSSYVNENKNKDGPIEDNERLEFFGDAIIEFYISEYLFNKYDSFPEGDMTKIRASMVCEQSLAECARLIHLGEFLFMGKGEEATGGRERDSIISDAFEAVTAAIYLDSGKEAVKKFIDDHLIKALGDKPLFYDAKTRLQEMIQKNGSNSLRYEILSEDGPSHNKMFTTAAFLNDREIGRGKGHSKKAAQQEAALQAIKTLNEKTSGNGGGRHE